MYLKRFLECENQNNNKKHMIFQNHFFTCMHTYAHKKLVFHTNVPFIPVERLPCDYVTFCYVLVYVPVLHPIIETLYRSQSDFK